MTTEQVEPKLDMRTFAARRRWKTRGVMGEYTLISKHELKIDHTYQRAESKRKAMEYAADWSWVACGTIAVALRKVNDTYEFWVMDGQHRVAAALLRDDLNNLPCLVFEMDDLEEEAQGFVDINLHRGAPTSTDKYRALLVAGDKSTLAINAMVTQVSNRTIAGHSSATTISCVGLLQTLWHSDAELLKKIFPVAVKFMEGETFHSNVLAAMFWLERATDPNVSLTERKMVNKLNTIGLAKVRQAIDEASAYLGKRTTRSAGLGLLKALNHGARNKLTVNENAVGDGTLVY